MALTTLVRSLIAGALGLVLAVLAGPASVLTRGVSMSIVRVGGDAALVPGVALAVDDAATFAQRWRRWR